MKDKAIPLDAVPGVMGYVNRPSTAPGETLRVHVSCDASDRWAADLVRLLSADLKPEGPPFREEPVEDVPAAERPALVQRTRTGSYVRVEHDPALAPAGGFTVATIVSPTLPGDGVQGLVSQRSQDGESGWTLQLDEAGAVCLWLATAARPVVLSTAVPLIRGCWYVVAATVDPGGGTARVLQRPIGAPAANRIIRSAARAEPATAEAALPGPVRHAPAGAPLLLAAIRLAPESVIGAFDGRLERPVLAGAPLEPHAATRLPLDPISPEVVAAWDFAHGIGRAGVAAPSLVHDRSSRGLHGQCVNHPTRAVTGHDWDGTETDFRHAPDQYGAAHFHRDDLTDCDWESQLELQLPEHLRSGVYAVRVTAGAAVDRIPFVVRPPRGRATAPLLLVLPTNSYLAYANQRYDLDSPRVQLLTRRVPQVDAFGRFREQHRGVGASLYDVHPDQTGVCHSSWRRPILTMRPTVRLMNGPAWQFTGDMQLVDWLDRTGREVDVVCDRDLHDEGAELLARYPAVITGTHPEYVTETMLDAYDAYLLSGGRLVYLGGNGFYWVTAYDPEDPNVIEIRRWGGTESWRALPGEYHISFTGEPGGLWRNRGRAPQKTTGTGFVAQGTDAASGYRRRAGLDLRAAWVFEGAEEELFGFFGTMGGAAGLELDAVDEALGTPPQAIVLASSEGHPDDMLEARENYGMTLVAPGGARNPRVRADMVLVPIGEGGVFAPGSIAWAGSLAHDGYDNPVSRILANVLDRFTAGLPLLDE